MFRLISFIVLAIALNIPIATNAAPISIDFEDIVAPGTASTFDIATWTFGNGRVKTTHGHLWDSAFISSNSGDHPDNGSDWYIHDNHIPLLVDTVDGSLFTLTSLDAADYYSGNGFDTQVFNVVGTFGGGGTISTQLTVTIAGWTTFSFDSEWKDLSSLSIGRVSGFYPAFDNILLNGESSGVPAPGAASLLCLGLFGLSATRRATHRVATGS